MLEESLKESEEKLRTILENSRDGINMFDLRTKKYLYMSPSQEQLYGFTMEEINNFSAEEAYARVHPDDYEICKEKHKMVATGIKTSVEVQYRWKVKNGEYRWFGDMRKVVYDENGQPIAIVGVSRDITEHKKYDEMLVLQAKILSNVNDAIIVVDENDRIIYCNNSIVKLLGWQEQEFIDRSFSFFVQGYLDEVSKEKVLLASEEIQKANSTVDEDFLDGIRCYSKNGTQIIADINRTIVRGPKGEFKGFIASLRDVSENYKYQIQLKKSEKKYRYLYNSIDEGFVIVEVILDEENKPKDLRFVELNSAYEKQTGIKNKDVLGKTAKELKFDIEDFWYETYWKVALTGEPLRFVKEENKIETIKIEFSDIYSAN